MSHSTLRVPLLVSGKQIWVCYRGICKLYGRLEYMVLKGNWHIPVVTSTGTAFALNQGLECWVSRFCVAPQPLSAVHSFDMFPTQGWKFIPVWPLDRLPQIEAYSLRAGAGLTVVKAMAGVFKPSTLHKLAGAQVSPKATATESDRPKTAFKLHLATTNSEYCPLALPMHRPHSKLSCTGCLSIPSSWQIAR